MVAVRKGNVEEVITTTRTVEAISGMNHTRNQIAKSKDNRSKLQACLSPITLDRHRQFRPLERRFLVFL